jgi:hypothetical protein
MTSGQQFHNDAVKPNQGICQATIIHCFIYYIYAILHVTVGAGSNLLHLTLVNTLLTTLLTCLEIANTVQKRKWQLHDLDIASLRAVSTVHQLCLML